MSVFKTEHDQTRPKDSNRMDTRSDKNTKMCKEVIRVKVR